ncbi:glycosyltransferase [Butyrivibrio sp. FC2001]|uniref:glycosyltransferase n=1 Tax=Butyrivibrio sp. FC2001 TaxID=1280671 RepID=UPI0003FD4901|nr:glycosyltransferase [Butyrivibrio sp. FC2001]
MEYRIQNIVLPSETKHKQCRELFYREDSGFVDDENHSLVLGYGQKVDFTTYINACSYKKWKEYTNAGILKIYLEVEGKCNIQFVGYSRNNCDVERRDYALIRNDNTERTIIEYQYPNNDEYMNGFELFAKDRCVFYGGYYTAECEEDKLNEVNLCIATPTCYKEKFIEKNINLIRSELIDSGEEISDHLFIHVVDNGRTLSETEISGKNIFLHPNSNSGGAGGFARGMIESMHQERNATHVLLMDDDILILPESIRRTYFLLKLLKNEYEESFISGAMLYYEEPYSQHEDIGTITPYCTFVPLKPKFDHRDIEDNLANEDFFIKQPNEYAGWWYCCIPISVIKKNGLPLPIFIRCDDIEYSLRCNANILTMNGIAVWHMGFVKKYNGAFDKYQQCRNLLIDKACSEMLGNVDLDIFIHRSFRTQMLKYNYDAAELVLRAFEDYVKGPDFLKENRGEEIVRENMKLNDKLEPLSNFGCVHMQNLFDCYYDPPRTFKNKWLLRLTYNGHYFIPIKWLKKNPAVIAFDDTYQPEKMTLCKNHLEVNPYDQTGKMLTIDKKRFMDLYKRYRKVRKYYLKNKPKIIKQYRDEKKNLTSEEFWKKYLMME